MASGLLAVGLVGGAGTAVADSASDQGQAGGQQAQGGASATLDGLSVYGTAVVRTDGGAKQTVPAGLFEMTVDGGGTLKTYCVDLQHPTQPGARYAETAWNQTSLGTGKDAGRIGWILQHSYPQVDDLAALAQRARTGPLTESAAAAGTQVAIWRYSDHADVSATDPHAEKLADYLQKAARSVPEPKASLSLTPAAVSGKAGSRIGPVTVHTVADSVSVTPPVDAAATGVKVTDKDGRPVTSAGDGTQLYFDVPQHATGNAAGLDVQATTSVPVGRAFSGLTSSQTQILAGSSDSTVSATASVDYAARGAVTSFAAWKDCAKGGVDVQATDNGDAPFTFELAGHSHTVVPGTPLVVTVPVSEDQQYAFTVTGAGGLSKAFDGVLDCRTAGSTVTALKGPAGPAGGAGPAAAGGASTGEVTGATTGLNLAETGSSNATPVIAGVAIAFVVVGGGALFLVRRKSEAAAAGPGAGA
jgi:TQXA domain-containing protein/LPXTG-motif cell wall-anchored protein